MSGRQVRGGGRAFDSVTEKEGEGDERRREGESEDEGENPSRLDKEGEIEEVSKESKLMGCCCGGMEQRTRFFRRESFRSLAESVLPNFGGTSTKEGKKA